MQFYDMSKDDSLFEVLVERVRISGVIKFDSNKELLRQLAEVVRIEIQASKDKEIAPVTLQEDQLEFSWYSKLNSVVLVKPVIEEGSALPLENLLFQPYSRQLSLDRECLK